MFAAVNLCKEIKKTSNFFKIKNRIFSVRIHYYYYSSRLLIVIFIYVCFWLLMSFFYKKHNNPFVIFVSSLTYKIINNMKFSGLRLLVDDFAKAFKFYSETLGFKVTWGDAQSGYASFDIGAGPDGLAIFPSDYMASVVGNAELTLPKNNRERTMLILYVDNVDKSYEELSARGVKFVNKPVDMPDWGMRVVYLRDTEDNLIELNMPLPKEQWSNDLQQENEKY